MYDTIIIGAGFAGLAAAKALREKGGDNLLVLEARNRVGGRTKPGKIAGLDIDLGGMWMGPTQTRLKQWAEELQVQTYSTPMEGKGCFRINGKSYQGEGESFDGLFNILEGTDYLSTQRKLKKLLAPLDCNAPWDHPKAADLDAMTVDQWLTANMRTKRMRTLFHLICFSLFCAEASQMSMLFFLHYVKSGDGLDIMLSSMGDGAQRYLFQGSVHQIARKIGEELGDRLHLSEPVSKVHWEDDGVEVVTDEGHYRGRKAIIAVPATLLHRIDFAPALPMQKAAFHNRISMGSAIKYWIAYDRPFWRDQGLNGLIFVDDHPCAPCMDVSPPGQDKGIIAGFFDGNHALDHSDRGMEAVAIFWLTCWPNILVRKRAIPSIISTMTGPANNGLVDVMEPMPRRVSMPDMAMCCANRLGRSIGPVPKHRRVGQAISTARSGLVIVQPKK